MPPMARGHFKPPQVRLFWKELGRQRRPTPAGKVLGRLERSRASHSPVPGRLTSPVRKAKPSKTCCNRRCKSRSPVPGEAVATRAIGGLRVRRRWLALSEVCANPNDVHRLLSISLAHICSRYSQALSNAKRRSTLTLSLSAVTSRTFLSYHQSHAPGPPISGSRVPDPRVPDR